MLIQLPHLIVIRIFVLVILCGLVGSAFCKVQGGEDTSPKTNSPKKESPTHGQDLPPNRPSLSVHATEDAYRYNAGPFAAIIAQVTDSSRGNYNIIRLNLRFENLTNHPLILAYRARSSILADDFHNTYFGAKAGEGPDTSVTGMGTDVDGKTDPQFLLEPNKADSATFEVWGHRAPNQQAPLFHYDVTIDEIDGSDTKKVLRQHSLYFGDFTARSLNPGQNSKH